jgi:hypothetical protein
MPDTGEEVGTSIEGTVATKSNVALKAPKSSNNKKRQQRSPNPVDTPGPKRRRTTNPVYDTTSGAASRPATRSETMRQRNQRNKG